MAFASPARALRAYDIKTDAQAMRAAKLDDYAASGVIGVESAAAAARDADLILSLVTADSAVAAANAVSAAIVPGALYCDMNSVAPQTKRAAAAAIERAGGRYADVAVMSPVHPARTAAPLLVSGPHAEAATEALRAIGFTNVRAVEGPVGAAAAIKMVRSVMVKGLEALTAECVLAAAAAGVSAEVIASLGGAENDWSSRADYNLDRMLVHGMRRAAEMEEVAKTLDDLGIRGPMTRAAIEWQRAIGTLGLAPPDGLHAKTTAILSTRAQAA